MASGYLPNPVSSGDLIAELAASAPKTGANTGLWPGLTVYRFTGPAGPTWLGKPGGFQLWIYCARLLPPFATLQ